MCFDMMLSILKETESETPNGSINASQITLANESFNRSQQSNGKKHPIKEPIG